MSDEGSLQGDGMVLRTVYIPLEMDGTLRGVSFSTGESKGDLMRRFIEEGLRRLKESGFRTIAERLDERAAEIAKGNDPSWIAKGEDAA